MKRKVWDITVKDNPNRVVMGENDEFYTTDTEAFLVFNLQDKDFQPQSAMLTLENRNDGSLKSEEVSVVGDNITWEMPQRYIEHFGNWQGQLVYEDAKDGQPELYTSAPFSFVVNAHIGDKKKPSLVEIENWEKFIRDGTELIETWENLEALREENERQRQANYQELLDTGVLQTNINTKLEALEEEYAPKLTEVTAQLARTQFQPTGFVHRNSALLDTNFDKKATLSFVTDDGNIEDLTHYKPLFDEFGYKFTMAIQTGYVDAGVDKNDNKLMTWEQIKFLSNEGHTVSSHTITHPHLNQISAEEKEKEMKESRDTLLSKGFDVRHIMYPHGSRDSETINLTKKYFLSGANVIATANSSNTDRGDINRISILGTSLDGLKAFIDNAIVNNHWIVFYFHGYEARYTHLGFMEKLRAILEYARESGIEVMTYDDAYDYFMRKKPLTEIPKVKVGNFFMSTDQMIDMSQANLNIGMPNFNAQRINTDNFYTYNRELNRIEFNEPGVYMVDYTLLMRLEKDARALISLKAGAMKAGSEVPWVREAHQNFYVSEAYADGEFTWQRPYPVSGSMIVNYERGVYDMWFIDLSVRIKKQSTLVQNKIHAENETTHITITKIQ